MGKGLSNGISLPVKSCVNNVAFTTMYTLPVLSGCFVPLWPWLCGHSTYLWIFPQCTTCSFEALWVLLLIPVNFIAPVWKFAPEPECKNACRTSHLWISKQDLTVRSCLPCTFQTPCTFVFATDFTNWREQTGPRHVAFPCSRLTWVVATFLIRCV